MGARVIGLYLRMVLCGSSLPKREHRVQIAPPVRACGAYRRRICKSSLCNFLANFRKFGQKYVTFQAKLRRSYIRVAYLGCLNCNYPNSIEYECRSEVNVLVLRDFNN